MCPSTAYYNLLYRLYEEFDTKTLRGYQEFVDLFPVVDFQVALNQWQEINTELENQKKEIYSHFPQIGEELSTIAALADREQAFTALDLYAKYERKVNVLILDVDETLRSAGNTNNEIPRETLHLLDRFHSDGVPIIICTGQTLENVKGFLIQGVGNDLVYSGDISIVYEAGSGVFTPKHGAKTKQLLFNRLDADIREIFQYLRSHIHVATSDALHGDYHLQGNEFNVTIKPNFETGSKDAKEVIDKALVTLLDLLEQSISVVKKGATECHGYARKYYSSESSSIHSVLDNRGELAQVTIKDVPDMYRTKFDCIDIGYYEADAAEIGSSELSKVTGVRSALDVLDVQNPFALVMGDSKSDLRVMRWAKKNNTGISAAPDHASQNVISHVNNRDKLVFSRGNAAEMLRTTYVLNRLAELEG